MQPLSVVENEGFVKFVKELDLQYQLPSCSTVTRSLLPKKYEKIKDALKCELMQVKKCSFNNRSVDFKSNFKLSHSYLPLHQPRNAIMFRSSKRCTCRKTTLHQILQKS